MDFAVIFLLLINIYKLRFKLTKPPLFVKAGLVFLAVCVLSLTLTPLHLTGVEYLNSFSYAVRWALYLLLGWVIFSNPDSNITKNPLRILEISGISLALLGLVQLFVLPDLRLLEAQGWDPHYFRAASTFFDPNFLGAYLALTCLAVSQGFTKTRRLKIFLFNFVYLVLLLTFSRSSYLMFLASFSTFAILTGSKRKFIEGLVLFAGLMVGFWIYTQLVSIPHGVDRKASASYRLSTWQQGLDVFQKSPVLGVGFNSYRYAIREYGLGGTQFLNSRGSTTNDLSLLYVAATTGVVGLASYLFFLASIFATTRVTLKTNKYSVILLSFLAGLLIHSIFNNSLFYPFILIWIMILAAKL